MDSLDICAGYGVFPYNSVKFDPHLFDGLIRSEVCGKHRIGVVILSGREFSGMSLVS